MSQTPAQSGPYVDTLIVDCSRATSEEVKGDPLNDVNALFTNKLGNGIKINPGDTITVSSAFVSERGCGGQVIEFKGTKQADQTYTLNESVITKPQLPNIFPLATASSVGNEFVGLDRPRNLYHPEPFSDFGPLGAKQVIHTKTPRTYQLMDNEVNVEISFYKTTNGEGYFHLPRRFDFKPKEGIAQTRGKPPDVMTVRQPHIRGMDMLGQAAPHSLLGTATKPFDVAVTYDCPYNGRACVSPRITKLCPADWYEFDSLEDMGSFGGIPLVTDIDGAGGKMLRSVCQSGCPRAGGLWDITTNEYAVLPKQVAYDGHALQGYCSKQKNDNSRYTIYAKDQCYYAEHIGDQPNNLNDSSNLPFPTYEVPNNYDAAAGTYGSPYASRDDFLGTDGAATGYTVCYDKEPAMTGYTKYTEIKNLKVPKGFNSPSNVAETLTNQLNKTKEQRTIHGMSGPWLGPYTSNPTAKDGNTDPGNTAYQGNFDTRNYNEDAYVSGFYTDPTSDATIQSSTFGTTVATGQRQILVSTILESETLKSFACGNQDTWSEQNFIQYRGGNPRDVGAVGAPVLASGTAWYQIPDAPSTTTVSNTADVNNIKKSTWESVNGGGVAQYQEKKPYDVANVQYMSNFQYIGVKRPELFDAFREFQKPQIDIGLSWRNYDALQCLTGLDKGDFDYAPFITTAEWTDANLLRFKAVFDAQSKYPEIFEGYQYSNVERTISQYNRITHPEVAKGVSPDYMRFLHLNSFSGKYPTQKVVQRAAGAPGSVTSLTEVPVYKHSSLLMPLGNDNCNTPLTDPHAHNVHFVSTWKEDKHTGGGVDTHVPLNTSRNAQDFGSTPLFVWYNQADKDNTVNNGEQDKNLAYGCMFRFSLVDPAIGPTLIARNGAGVAVNMDANIVQELWDHHIDPVTKGPYQFIGFNTEKIGGIPEHISDPWVQGAVGGIAAPSNFLNTPNAGGVYGIGLGCGFDVHFNAYGTSCISLYSGYLDGDKYAVDTLSNTPDIPGNGTAGADKVKGEYYMDRGTAMPEPKVTAAITGTNTPLTNSAAIVNKKKLTAKSNPEPVPLPGQMITGAGPDIDRIQQPCFVVSFDANSLELTMSSEQTLEEDDLVQMNTSTLQVSYHNLPISKYIRERYVGANQPLLNFDSNGERFNFQQLHSPLYIGNEANAGDGLTSVALEEGKQVLEINRRLMGNDFTPEMMPYQIPIARTKKSADSDQTPPIQPMNRNLIPWQVYDSDGGIFLENFGLTENQWKLSLWGVLGFSYGQFHPTGPANRQARINNIIETTNLLAPTTNANLEANDVVKFRGNRYGSSMYTFQPPIGSVLGPFQPPVGLGALNQTQIDFPVITIDQTSAQINAENLPRKMLKPFFLIKSNIIGDMAYWGGGDSGQNLPIVCVVNKENGFGDFYFQRGFDMEFTATIPRIITSVTTSIHDPDMKLATCGPDSSVIFKITKQNHANLDVVSDVLQQQQKYMMKHKDKLKFQAEEQARAQARVAGQEPVAAPIGMGVGAGEAAMPQYQQLQLQEAMAPLPVPPPAPQAWEVIPRSKENEVRPATMEAGLGATTLPPPPVGMDQILAEGIQNFRNVGGLEPEPYPGPPDPPMTESQARAMDEEMESAFHLSRIDLGTPGDRAFSDMMTSVLAQGPLPTLPAGSPRSTRAQAEQAVRDMRAGIQSSNIADPVQVQPGGGGLSLVPAGGSGQALEPEPMPDSPIDVGVNDPEEKDQSRKRLGPGAMVAPDTGEADEGRAAFGTTPIRTRGGGTVNVPGSFTDEHLARQTLNAGISALSLANRTTGNQTAQDHFREVLRLDPGHTLAREFLATATDHGRYAQDHLAKYLVRGQLGQIGGARPMPAQYQGLQLPQLPLEVRTNILQHTNVPGGRSAVSARQTQQDRTDEGVYNADPIGRQETEAQRTARLARNERQRRWRQAQTPQQRAERDQRAQEARDARMYADVADEADRLRNR